MPAPTQYLKDEGDITDRSVVFAGAFIDIKRMAEEEGFDYTYLSHVFSANSPKIPSIKTGVRIAEALGMDYGDFINQILLKKSPDSEK